MEKGSVTDRFVKTLSTDRRVLVLGGMAVIAHGLSRPTKDTDIWLDPMASAETWVDVLITVMEQFPGTSFWSLAGQAAADRSLAVQDARIYGLIRVAGLDMPLDVFRRPNECDEVDFDAFWDHSSPLADGIGLPDPIDLYLTKVATGREQDWQDQIFLESKVKAGLKERLPECTLKEARDLFARFLDPESLEYALKNPDSAIRDLALEYLRQFEDEGDPFSRDVLQRWREETGELD